MKLAFLFPYALLLAAAANAGPVLFEDFLKAPAAGANVMNKHDSYYYTESKVVDLRLGAFSNCAKIEYNTPIAETSLVCPHDEFQMTGAALSPVGTCSWEFKLFDDDLLPIPVPGSESVRIGKAEAVCKFNDAFDSCAYGAGPDCGDATMRIDAWIFDTPAWFKAIYDPTLENDNRMSCNIHGGGTFPRIQKNPDSPSCCILAREGLIDWQPACFDCYSRILRSANGTQPRSTLSRKPAAASAPKAKAPTGTGKAKAPTSPDNKATKADIPDESTTTYYLGDAIIISGEFTIECPEGHKGQKWSTKGKMDWVVDVGMDCGQNPCRYPLDALSAEVILGPITGTPPSNLYPADPGKFRFKFNKLADEYSYGDGYDKPSGYDKPQEYYDKPHGYDKPYGYERPYGYEKPHGYYEKPYSYDRPYEYGEGPYRHRGDPDRRPN